MHREIPALLKYMEDREMTFRELLNIMPNDSITTIDLHYFNEQEQERVDTYFFNLESDDADYVFSSIMLEHFAEDDVIELTNHVCALCITVDRIVSTQTVNAWKTAAANRARLSYILRDWEE